MGDREVEASLSLLGMMEETQGASLVLAVATRAARESSSRSRNSSSSTSSSNGKRQARLSSLARELTLEQLRVHFGKPIVQVARELGICTTFLKKICRRCGIKRWPHRQIRSLARTAHMLRQLQAQAESDADRVKYARQIALVEDKQRAVFEDPDARGRVQRVKKLPAATSSTSSTASSTASSDLVGEDMLEDASLLAEAASAISSSAAAAASPPLGVMIPPLPAEIEPGKFTTPVHAVASLPPPVELISPSHRKVAVMPKGDAEQRLRSTSIGSLQEAQAELLKVEVPPLS